MWWLKILGYTETTKYEGFQYCAIWIRIYVTTVEVQYMEHTPITETHEEIIYFCKEPLKFFDNSPLLLTLDAVNRFVLLPHP